MKAVLIFGLDALLTMHVPEIGADIFKKFEDSACVIPPYVLREIKSNRFKRRTERVRAVKLIFTIQDVCGFADRKELGAGSKTLIAYHEGVEVFLPQIDMRLDKHGVMIPSKRFPRVTRESKTVAIARYLQNKYKQIPVAIVSVKQGLHKLAAESGVNTIFPDEADEFQKMGVVKKKKTERFRRHAVGGGVFGKWI